MANKLKKELLEELQEAGLPATSDMKKAELQEMYDEAKSDGVFDESTEEETAEDADSSDVEEAPEQEEQELQDEEDEESSEESTSKPSVISMASEYFVELRLKYNGKYYQPGTLVTMTEDVAENLVRDGVIREIKK